ncbi:major facilitator superfamily transporter [Colletotrichum sojae]|uniref:Major facilitator superfamily transporter n=1 Tax=Colletotrichum sojae TaxID=2175907 RepID=A0A8H6IPG2_9PEZI|nr:major facilitator superfamily transporter [Colletotrichum sojae]
MAQHEEKDRKDASVVDVTGNTSPVTSKETYQAELEGPGYTESKRTWSSNAGDQVNAPLYIAFLEFAWTVFTFATAGVKDVNQLYVFRFLYVPTLISTLKSRVRLRIWKRRAL